MPLTGDWKRLEATVRAMRSLARVPAVASVEGAKAIKREIERSFKSARDPYGNAWAPHAPATIKKWGKHKLLQLTGKGRASIVVRPLPGAGIYVESPSEGLAFAQGGTKNEPKRRFLPENQLPATWNRALEKATDKAIKESLRNAG
jgi:hypothetical protein